MLSFYSQQKTEAPTTHNKMHTLMDLLRRCETKLDAVDDSVGVWVVSARALGYLLRHLLVFQVRPASHGRGRRCGARVNKTVE